MSKSSGQTTSPPTPRIECDVCVVGAGPLGLWVTKYLAESGYSVVVLEKNRIGGGASSHAQGFLHHGFVDWKGRSTRAKAEDKEVFRPMWQVYQLCREGVVEWDSICKKTIDLKGYDSVRTYHLLDDLAADNARSAFRQVLKASPLELDASPLFHPWDASLIPETSFDIKGNWRLYESAETSCPPELLLNALHSDVQSSSTNSVLFLMGDLGTAPPRPGSPGANQVLTVGDPSDLKQSATVVAGYTVWTTGECADWDTAVDRKVGMNVLVRLCRGERGGSPPPTFNLFVHTKGGDLPEGFMVTTLRHPGQSSWAVTSSEAWMDQSLAMQKTIAEKLKTHFKWFQDHWSSLEYTVVSGPLVIPQLSWNGETNELPHPLIRSSSTATHAIAPRLTSAPAVAKRVVDVIKRHVPKALAKSVLSGASGFAKWPRPGPSSGPSGTWQPVSTLV